jgi:hypothetical protein
MAAELSKTEIYPSKMKMLEFWDARRDALQDAKCSNSGGSIASICNAAGRSCRMPKTSIFISDGYVPS